MFELGLFIKLSTGEDTELSDILKNTLTIVAFLYDTANSVYGIVW